MAKATIIKKLPTYQKMSKGEKRNMRKTSKTKAPKGKLKSVKIGKDYLSKKPVVKITRDLPKAEQAAKKAQMEKYKSGKAPTARSKARAARGKAFRVTQSSPVDEKSLLKKSIDPKGVKARANAASKSTKAVSNANKASARAASFRDAKRSSGRIMKSYVSKAKGKAKAVASKGKAIAGKAGKAVSSVAKKVLGKTLRYSPTGTDKKIVSGGKKILGKVLSTGRKYGKTVAKGAGKTARVGGKVLGAVAGPLAIAEAVYSGVQRGKRNRIKQRATEEARDTKMGGSEAQSIKAVAEGKYAREIAKRKANPEKYSAKNKAVTKALDIAEASRKKPPMSMATKSESKPQMSMATSSPTPTPNKPTGNKGNFGGSGDGESKKWQRGPGKMMVKTEAYKKAKAKARRS